MNETNPPWPTPPQIPPQAPPIPASAAGQRPLGEDPAERVAITSVIGVVEAVLRQPRRLMYQLRQPGNGRLVGFMILASMVCSLVYGVVVGSFAGHEQLWRAPVKVSGGLLVSALICLPSLYIFACLSGAQARLAEIFGLVTGLLLLMTLLLIGFAPVAWLFSQSTESLVFMGGLHLAFWFVATIFGLRFLEAGFAHSQARSRAGFNTWVVIFMLVLVQMSTALRPIIGRAPAFFPEQKQFFLNHWGECMDEPQKAAANDSR